MPNYAGLKAEIAKPAYSSMTDAQIVAALNVLASGPSVATNILNIIQYLRSVGKWAAIRADALGTSPRAATVALLDLYQDIHTLAVDLTASNYQTGLNALLTAGLIAAADVTALTALCQTSASIAQSYGFAQATLSELAAARLWPGVSLV